MGLTDGQLCNVQASLNGFTAGKSLARDSTRFQTFHIAPYEDSFGLLLRENEVFAVLHESTCKTLQRLNEHQKVKATAVVETSKLKTVPLKGASKGIFPLSVNVYGTKDVANEAGDILTEMDAFLQHPFFLEQGIEYSNPQYFHVSGGMQCMTHLVGLDEAEYRAKRISDDVECVFDSLDTMTRDGADIVTNEQPNAIITRLKEYV